MQSTTVHAETACLLSASFATQGAKLYSTDPLCPNCSKNAVEAGVTENFYRQSRL